MGRRRGKQVVGDPGAEVAMGKVGRRFTAENEARLRAWMEQVGYAPEAIERSLTTGVPPTANDERGAGWLRERGFGRGKVRPVGDYLRDSED